MGSNSIIVREYLESLKEDTELDYLFPIMLSLMGFKIISTAKESKGQSQYGKDIIAIGLDENKIKHRYYFELKGYDAKDITDYNYSVKDGVRESIIEAKDTAFNDSSIPAFNTLPIKIVFVHNGTIKANVRPTFDGFIKKEFPNGGFERWDIYELTDLFSEYLFSEYLLTDEDSLKLFKRTLALLDAPDYDYQDFYQLVDLQIAKVPEVRSRAFKKLFATLNLLSFIILQYSKDKNNLHPARECLTYLVLKVWAWILRNKLEIKEPVLIEYRKLIRIHYDMLDEYFKKTLPFVKKENGLYSGQGSFFEAIGYPLRSFEYLNYLIYFMQARKYWPKFSHTPNLTKDKSLGKSGKLLLQEIIDKNDGCSRPIIDNHSIAIVNVLLYFLKDKDLRQPDIDFIAEYIMKILSNIRMIKVTRNRYPELNNNLKALTEFVSTGSRPHNYIDSSTLLVTTIFEFIALLNGDQIYDTFKENFQGKFDFQIACPNIGEYDIEQLLFEKHFDEEFHVESGIEITEDIKQFKSTIQEKEIENIQYRTDKVGFPYLRTLAHIYYENEFFPNEWRALFPPLTQ